MKIKELPIETIYGEQKSYLKVIPYVFNVLKNDSLILGVNLKAGFAFFPF